MENSVPRTLLVLLLLAVLGSGARAAPLTAATDVEALGNGRSAKGRAVAEAWLIAPTTRYRHFVRGNTAEAGGLRVRLRDGRVLTHLLGDDQVFEDDAPRLADLDGDGTEELVLVLTSLRAGASLAVFAVGADGIELRARTPFIGQPNRWLNPAGIADFDGDGRLEIALVQMPHLAKRLELWRLGASGLERVLSFDDITNHRIGSVHTDMSAVVDVDGDGVADLVIPDGARRKLRILSFASGRTKVIADVPLPGLADGPIAAAMAGEELRLTARLEGGTSYSVTVPPLAR
jgi:hypothetical protein